VAVERLLNPGEHFEAFGDPLSLVLTGTRDPTRFVYLSEGVGDWAVRHAFGGFEARGGVRERATLRGVPLERPWHLSCRLGGRGIREHPLRVDAGVDGPGIHERRPALAVAGHVDVEQRLPQRAA
jgi:hypothetical protein